MSDRLISNDTLEQLNAFNTEESGILSGLVKGAHSKNITLSDWNELVHSSDVSLADVKRLYDVLVESIPALEDYVITKMEELPEVVDETGTRTDAVMTQKSISELLYPFGSVIPQHREGTILHIEDEIVSDEIKVTAAPEAKIASWRAYTTNSNMFYRNRQLPVGEEFAKTVNGITYWVGKNGEFTIDGTEAKVDTWIYLSRKEDDCFLKAGHYMISLGMDAALPGDWEVQFAPYKVDANGEYVLPSSFSWEGKQTTNAAGKRFDYDCYLQIRVFVSATNKSRVVIKPQVNYGYELLDWEAPYRSIHSASYVREFSTSKPSFTNFYMFATTSGDIAVDYQINMYSMKETLEILRDTLTDLYNRKCDAEDVDIDLDMSALGGGKFETDVQTAMQTMVDTVPSLVAGASVEIVQEGGNRADAVMSQIAVTNLMANAEDRLMDTVHDIEEELSNDVSNSSNAVKATARGATVVLNDVSPIPHPMKIQLRSKNILPFPYYRATPYTQNGITFTLNEDRSITMNGTANGNAYFHFYYGVNYLTAGTYALYSPTTTSKVQTTLEFYSGNTAPFTWIKGITQTSATGKTITLSEEEVEKITRCYLFVLVMNGTTLNNYTVRPMLCESDQVIDYYTPYLTDFTGVKLVRYGRTESDNKLTITADADGTVDGLYPLYPITTLVPDVVATVEVKYNQDSNAALYGKLDKLTKASGVNVVYGVSPQGQQRIFDMTASSTGKFTVVMRDDYGRFCAEEPTSAKQVANKTYVDDKMAGTLGGIEREYYTLTDTAPMPDIVIGVGEKKSLYIKYYHSLAEEGGAKLRIKFVPKQGEHIDVYALDGTLPQHITLENSYDGQCITIAITPYEGVFCDANASHLLVDAEHLNCRGKLDGDSYMDILLLKILEIY